MPKPPAPPPAPGGIAADVLARRIDEFLTSRGYRPTAAPPDAGTRSESGGGTPARKEEAAPPAPSPQRVETTEKPVDFVCEDDVRQAMKQGRKIVTGERTIVTPAARDLGEQNRVFVQASWPR